MKKNKSILARRIIEARQAKNMLQTDLAVAIGVMRHTITHWETDRYTPRIELLVALADVLDVSVDWLLGRSLTIPNDDLRTQIQRLKHERVTLMHDVAITRSCRTCVRGADPTDVCKACGRNKAHPDWQWHGFQEVEG